MGDFHTFDVGVHDHGAGTEFVFVFLWKDNTLNLDDVSWGSLSNMFGLSDNSSHSWDVTFWSLVRGFLDLQFFIRDEFRSSSIKNEFTHSLVGLAFIRLTFLQWSIRLSSNSLVIFSSADFTEQTSNSHEWSDFGSSSDDGLDSYKGSNTRRFEISNSSGRRFGFQPGLLWVRSDDVQSELSAQEWVDFAVWVIGSLVSDVSHSVVVKNILHSLDFLFLALFFSSSWDELINNR